MPKSKDTVVQLRSEMQQAFESLQLEMRQGFAEITRHLVDHSARLNSLEKRLDSMESRFEARFDSIDARFDSIDARLDSMQQSITDIKDHVIPSYAREVVNSIGGYLMKMDEWNEKRFIRIEKHVGIVD